MHTFAYVDTRHATELKRALRQGRNSTNTSRQLWVGEVSLRDEIAQRVRFKV